MNLDNGQLIYAIWAIWAMMGLVAVSGLYPASKLYASTKPAAKNTFWIITALAAVAPFLFLACDRLRVYVLDRNNPWGLKSMPAPIDALPFMYVLSAAVAAMIFWVVFAWHGRTAA
jgi:hypothetical protein